MEEHSNLVCLLTGALLANLNSSRENEATKWYFHVWSRRSAASKGDFVHSQKPSEMLHHFARRFEGALSRAMPVVV